MIRYLIIMVLLNPTIAVAKCDMDSSRCDYTILGYLEQKSRNESTDDYSRLMLNGQEIFKSKSSYMVVGNPDSVLQGKKRLITKVIISYLSDDACYPNKPESYCKKNVVLDLSSGKPVISNDFFSDFSDSHITWVSWGKTNAIIVIDNQLRFKYSNGHVERVTQENKAVGKLSE